MLYQLVERHYPEFLEQLSHQGKSPPKHVEKEFEEFLKCGLRILMFSIADSG